jgi:hypothetical protein
MRAQKLLREDGPLGSFCLILGCWDSDVLAFWHSGILQRWRISTASNNSPPPAWHFELGIPDNDVNAAALLPQGSCDTGTLTARKEEARKL